jgi:RNA polymerase sigma factor (sigma-70 family)
MCLQADRADLQSGALGALKGSTGMDALVHPQRELVLAELAECERSLRAWLECRFGKSLRRHEIDDVIQDVYLRVCKADLTEVESTKGYLFWTARNVVFDRLKRCKRMKMQRIKDLEQVEVDEEVPDVEADLIMEEEVYMRQRLVREAIASLPKQCGTVLWLCKIEGLSILQIASQLGIAKSTVRKQLRIGVDRLRSYFLSKATPAGKPIGSQSGRGQQRSQRRE